MIPHEKIRLIRVLDDISNEYGLLDGEWILCGSGVLVLHGIDRGRPMGDVDIFVATRVWFEIFFKEITRENPWKIFTTEPHDAKRRVDPPYLYRDMHGIEVNIFQDWRRRGIGDIDVAFWMNNAEKVEGWPCTPLQFMLDWKEQVGRSKDATDIECLKKHLNREKK
jgi:hypothetical protein